MGGIGKGGVYVLGEKERTGELMFVLKRVKLHPIWASLTFSTVRGDRHMAQWPECILG